MTRTLYRRESAFMRFTSAFVALAFTLSLAGSGFAVPQDTTPAPAEPAPVVSEAPAPDPGVPAAPDPVEATPADPSVVAPPTTTDPGTTGTGGAPKVAQPDSGTGWEGAFTSRPAARSTALAPAAGSGDISIVDFQGYNLGQAKWTNGNLGKEYNEGDWVPYRLVLRNTGAGPVAVSPIEIGLDHFDSNPNAAVMFDKSRMWGVAFTGTAPTSGDGAGTPAGYSAITPASQDVPQGGAFGAGATIATSFNAGAFTIPAGQYAVVYFQGHLAMTAVWQLLQPGTDGAGGYPGSSGHGYLQMDAGARTLPLPSVVIPGGSVKVVKFYDSDKDGVKDAGETQLLSGWKIHLSGGVNGYSFNLERTTDASGVALFDQLPPGTYTVTEDLQAGWDSQFVSQSVTIASGGSSTVYVGNYHPDVEKSWSLSIADLPMGAQPWVSYKVDGVAESTNLSGSGPYTGSVMVPYGATISDVEWFVTWAGEDISLGTSAGEQLFAAKTNPFTYAASVSGAKFDDANGNGRWDAGEDGLSGWTITLKRVTAAGEITYASKVTGADGAYTFSGVLPGTYKVYETQQAGWLMTVSPTGSFTVERGSAITGKDFGNLFINSSILVEKSGVAKAHEGDTIEYTIRVTNTGNYTLYDVIVSDPMLGLSETIPSMASGAFVEYTRSYTVPQDSDDPLVNVAAAAGVDALGARVADDDDHTVDIIKPDVELVKSVSPDIGRNPVDVVYTFTATNNGEDPLFDLVITDDKIAGTIGSIDVLNPGDSVSFDVPATLVADVTNIGTVVAYDELGLMVSDTDDATVEVYNPSISIVKTADPVVILEGELVQYTYFVTNTGDITLTDVTVEDNILGPIGYLPMLAPAGTGTLTVTVPVNADVTNIGSVVGTYGEVDTPFYGTVSDTSEATVDVVHPAITVEKSASASAVVKGTEVTYDFLVTNTGDVTLYEVSVVDDKLGTIGIIPMLLPGASETLSASAVLNVSTTNTVVATGTDEYGHEVSDEDTVRVPVYDPSILLEKTAAPTTILSGEDVTYTFKVTNTGDITLTDVEVTDDKLGFIGTIPSLAPGAFDEISTTVPIDVDTVNVGTAVGTYGDPGSDFGGTVSDDDDAAVNVIAPSIDVQKSAAPSPVISGTTVTYTYVVTNTGDVTLYDVVVTDDQLGQIGVIDELAVGASETLTKDAVLTETTTNVVTATGYDELEHMVTDQDSARVPVYNPAIRIVKGALPDVVLSGEDVTYTYVVTNIGDITLSDIDVTDDKLGYIGSISMLAPDHYATLTITVPIDSDVTNIATAVGYYGTAETAFFGSVSDTDDAMVDVIHPAIDVTKVGSPNPVLTGSSVTYTFVVTNIGDVPLFNVLVTDDKLGEIGTIDELAVGASSTLTKSANLTETTTNVVTVTGYDRLEHPVIDTATETVYVYDPQIEIIKSVDPTVVLSGEEVTYSFAVTNKGDIELHNVLVTDDKLGEIGVIDSLAIGETVTLTKTAAITVDTPNVATAVGSYGSVESQFYGMVSDDDDAYVEVVAPAIDLVKTASADAVESGTSVTYTFVVTNIGDVPLFNVLVTDDKLGDIGTIASLGVGASQTLTADAVLGVPTLNVATATGADEYGHEVSDTDDAFVDVFAPFTDTAIDKSVNKTVAKPGETVIYTLTYRLTAGKRLDSVTIVDDFDERYMTPVDLNGGSVADGKITWVDNEPLLEGQVRTITYSMKIDDKMPLGTTALRNTVVINPYGDSDTTTVNVTVGEPFLPFTGGDWVLLALIAAVFAAAGLAFRRLAVVTGS